MTALKRCNICYEACRKKLKPCGHLTHKKCLQDWHNQRPENPLGNASSLTPQCPECKAVVTFPKLETATSDRRPGRDGIPCPLIDNYTCQCPQCGMYAERISGCYFVTCICGWSYSIPRSVPFRFPVLSRRKILVLCGLAVILVLMWLVYPPEHAPIMPVDPDIHVKIQDARQAKRVSDKALEELERIERWQGKAPATKAEILRLLGSLGIAGISFGIVFFR